jgi:Predicted DNA-binding proteins
MGIPAKTLQGVRLSVEEVEAIRLKDLEGLGQEECAEKMRISRPTFHRILEVGRRKLADGLINGKAIQIEGGNFGLPQSHFKCNNDGHEWDVPFETLANKAPLACPVCFSANIQSMPPPPFGYGRGGGRGFRGGRR